MRTTTALALAAAFGVLAATPMAVAAPAGNAPALAKGVHAEGAVEQVHRRYNRRHYGYRHYPRYGYYAPYYRPYYRPRYYGYYGGYPGYGYYGYGYRRPGFSLYFRY